MVPNDSLCPCCGNIDCIKKGRGRYMCTICGSILKEPMVWKDIKEI